jgi:HSP20 family protein
MRLVPYIRKSELPTRFFPDTRRFFEEFFNDFPVTNSVLRRDEQWAPAVDILEKDGSLILRAELPGMNDKDIDLKLEGRELTLSGERKSDIEENRQNYHRVERCYGTFSRSFTLPETVDIDKIKADYKNGVLTVTLPHKPEAKAREIPVSIS